MCWPRTARSVLERLSVPPASLRSAWMPPPPTRPRILGRIRGTLKRESSYPLKKRNSELKGLQVPVSRLEQNLRC